MRNGREIVDRAALEVYPKDTTLNRRKAGFRSLRNDTSLYVCEPKGDTHCGSNASTLL